MWYNDRGLVRALGHANTKRLFLLPFVEVWGCQRGIRDGDMVAACRTLPKSLRRYGPRIMFMAIIHLTSPSCFGLRM